MGHIEQARSTAAPHHFNSLRQEGRGKGGISISAKLGQVVQHWLADLAVQKQKGI